MRQRDWGSKIRTIMLISVLCVGIFAGGCGNTEGKQQELEIDDSVKSQVVDICSDGNIFYLAAQKNILLYDEKGKLQDNFPYNDRIIAAVAFGEDLYALDGLNGEILKIDEKSGIIEDNLLTDMMIYSLYGLSESDGILYLSCAVKEQDGITDAVYRIDMDKEEIERIYEAPICIYPYEGEKYLMKFQDILYHGQMDGTQPEKLEGMAVSVNAVSYDKKDQSIYYVDDNGIYQYRDGEVLRLHALDFTAWDIAVAGDTIMVLSPGERIVLATKAANVSDEVLTLYNVNDILISDNQAIVLTDVFEKQYGIKTDNRQTEGYSYEQFLTDVMSGSDKYDIYAIRTTQADIEGFKENHAFYDLSESEILLNTVEGMYTPIRNGAWVGDELFGIPWETDAEVFCYIQEQIPEGQQKDVETWEGLLDVIDQTDRDDIYRLVSSRVSVEILNQYLARYCNVNDGKYDFDTEEFRKVLHLLKRADAMNLPESLSENSRVAGTEELLPADKALGWADLMSYQGQRGVTFVYPSIAGESGSVIAKQTYLVVNPNSQHKEQAIEFLEFLCQHSQVKENVLLFPGENDEKLTDLMENHLVYLTGYQGEMSEMFDIINAYCAGEIAEDEAIRQITQKVYMQIQG